MNTINYYYLSLISILISTFTQYKKFIFLLNEDYIVPNQANGLGVALGIILFPFLIFITHLIVHLAIYNIIVKRHKNKPIDLQWLVSSGSYFKK
ncbi:hypothetical protein [Paenibacillus marinisediminis]